MEQYQKYIGKVLEGRYLVEKLIGVGGMSLVFLARDNTMNREVAIKLLREELMSDEDAVERFLDESRAVMMLSHKNIVKCFDYSGGDDLKFIVMEYAKGCTLKDYLQNKGVLSPQEVMNYSVEILSALVHAHSKNIIHRDIKPQNVLLTNEGTVKVTDFGIAKLPSDDPLSVSCNTVGTVDYISPEQAAGKPIDCRSDLYSLGIMMYEMGTGKLPFVAENPMAVAYMQISDKPTPPTQLNPDLPKGLEQVILRAISKNPSDRFESAKQMLDCLLRLRENPDAMFDFVTVVDENGEEESSQKGGDLLFSAGTLSTPESRFKDVSVSAPKATGKRRKKEKKKKRVIREKIVVKKPAHVSMVAMMLGILLAMGLVALTAGFYLFDNYFSPIIRSDDAQEIIVGDFAGQVYNAELQSELEQIGYQVTLEWVVDSDKLYGTVISQSPKKNSRRTVIPGESYCDLTLYVSSGENLITLDNYVGMEYRDASILMTAQKISYRIEKVFSETMPQGLIVSTYPAGGTAISPDTTLTVYVSKGPQVSYTTVPDLTGLSVTQVSDRLARAGLLLGRVSEEYSTSVPSGTVIRQSIPRNSVVPSGLTKIDLVISRGGAVRPESQPSPQPEPEPSAAPIPESTLPPAPEPRPESDESAKVTGRGESDGSTDVTRTPDRVPIPSGESDFWWE